MLLLIEFVCDKIKWIAFELNYNELARKFDYHKSI